MSKLTEDDFEKNSSTIGEIGNYYGGLHCAEVGGKYYWSIEDYSGFDIQEIPFYLYEALKAFESQLDKQA